MKKFSALFLILTFMLPTFGPWMPHDALRVIHVQQEQHHGDSEGQHDHYSDTHDTKSKASHSIHFDVVTYFSDYLHVDLKNADYAALSVPYGGNAPDYMMGVDITASSFPPISDTQATGPPPDYEWRMSSSATPIYLATQRLRI